MSIPEPLSSMPFWQWQLNAVTLIVLAQFFKAIYAWIKENGGIRNIWTNFLGKKSP